MANAAINRVAGAAVGLSEALVTRLARFITRRGRFRRPSPTFGRTR
jgi:hypothetical protein